MKALAVVTFLMVSVLVGCASTDDEIVENPRVPAAAFAAEGMTLHPEPPLHPEWKPVKFYFKKCEETGVGDHYSKTSYHCSYP